MDNIFAKALQKITTVMETENIPYMIVGGFAVSYHNRARTTNDIDLVVQVYPHDVKKILKHFKEWEDFMSPFEESVQKRTTFNITDFDTGIRYDFMPYIDSDYNWVAFERRQLVSFFEVNCYICSKEDLILFKLMWYNLSESEKQLEDIKFLLLDKKLNQEYLQVWIYKLKIETNGLLE